MALSTYLYEGPVKGDGTTHVEGIRAMLFTIDPVVTTTTAARKAAAMAELTVVTGLTLPTDYFTSEKLIGAAAGGLLPSLADSVIFEGGEQVETIA